MKLSLWLHFGSVLVASAAASFFFLQFTIRLPAPLHLWLLLVPIPWLAAALRLSRRSDIPHASWQIFSASCCLAAVCICATVLIVTLVFLH
jgi:hypothetical protein